MEFPLISVIVPVYNAEKQLVRCLDALLNQHYPSFELLFIDDGSQDQSAFILDEYVAKYRSVRVFHKKNGGASSARNYGLEMAKGEWVAFCDSDDYVSPNWLRLFAAHISDQVGLIVQPFSQKPLTKDLSFNYEKVFEGNVTEFLENYFDSPMIGSLCNKLFALSVIREYSLRFNESFKLREDEDFLVHYLKMLGKGTSVVHSSYGGYYYEMPNFSAKYKYVANFYETLFSIFLEIKAIHTETPIPRAYAYALKSLTHALWDLFLHKEKTLWKSLKLYHSEVGNTILRVPSFPYIFRVILSLPPFISFSCLRILGIVVQLVKH